MTENSEGLSNIRNSGRIISLFTDKNPGLADTVVVRSAFAEKQLPGESMAGVKNESAVGKRQQKSLQIDFLLRTQHDRLSEFRR